MRHYLVYDICLIWEKLNYTHFLNILITIYKLIKLYRMMGSSFKNSYSVQGCVNHESKNDYMNETVYKS